jgi:hypothetical protein
MKTLVRPVHMKTLVQTTLIAGLVMVTATSHAAILFNETFGSLADGTTLTTANTSFNYARASTGSNPVLAAINPGAFSGAAGLLSATNTSITGLGALSGTYSAFDVGTFSLSLRTPADISGTFFLEAGTGNSFTNNVTFSTNDLLFGIQINNGVLQTRTGGAFVTFGSTLAASTNYDIEVDFNNSATTAINSLGGSIATKTADVFINGVLVGDDIGIQGAQSATGFRLYTISDVAGNSFQIDNVVLTSVVPEPSSALSLVGGLGMMLLMRPRSRASRG